MLPNFDEYEYKIAIHDIKYKIMKSLSWTNSQQYFRCIIMLFNEQSHLTTTLSYNYMICQIV